MSCF